MYQFQIFSKNLMLILVKIPIPWLSYIYMVDKLILKWHSSQVFHCWPKCREEFKPHSHQISTFYVFSFSRYYSSKLIIFLFSVAILSVLWWKIKYWKADLGTFEKLLIYYSIPNFILTTTLLPNTYYFALGLALTFWNSISNGQHWQNFVVEIKLVYLENKRL